jgi:hypothetical protein
MFKLDPIDRDFVPFSKRLVLANDEDFFVDGGAGAGRASSVMLQDLACKNVPCGGTCTTGRGKCDSNGFCVLYGPVDCP